MPDRTYTNALHALPTLDEGEGLAWNQSDSRWHVYKLTDGTEYKPDLFRLGNKLVAASEEGADILHKWRYRQ